METPKSLSACIAAIRRLNARFRRLAKKDGPAADALMAEKDRLIDAMAALCPHPEIIGTRGAKAWGPMRMKVGPRRLCTACGCCETPVDGAYAALSGKAALSPLEEYLRKQGAVLLRLGINV